MASSKKSKTESIVSSEVQQIEKGKIKLTFKVKPERFREGLQHSYNRSKQHFNVPGFRKGKAPRKIIEQMYGAEVFFDDAISFVLSDAYEAALDKHEFEPVYKPEIELGEVSEKEGAEIFATFFVHPEVEVSDYFGLTYPQMDVEATEEDIQTALRAEQEKNSRQVSVNRSAEIGDVVTINFKGYMNDKPFEGGTGEDHDLKLGSGQFIPGIEEQVVGHSPGDNFKVEVTFPEEYHYEEFAGKPAVFELEVLDVKANKLPEINDEFAEDVSEFDTLAEFREDLAKRIREHKKANLENKRRAYVTKKLVAVAKMEVPEEMYLGRLDDMIQDFTRQIEMRGMDIENYMRLTQTTEATLKAAWRQQAEDAINGMLALEAVAAKEALTVNDEELEKRVSEVTGKEGDELAKIIKEMHPARRKELERSILCENALDLIIEKATATDELFEDSIVLEEGGGN